MTKASELDLREDLIRTCLKMAESGLTFGTSGNASVRLNKDTILITPTGVSYDSLKPADLVALREDGHCVGTRKPSSEWRFHRDILMSRRDVNAIVHTHSISATALACLGKEIPPFHYMVAIAGGASIRCAPYATFGTQALSNYAIKALEGRSACLLSNHGQIALGADLGAALKIAGEVETLATMYLRATDGGEPILLSQEEMTRVLKKFRTYGDQNAAIDDGLTFEP